MLQCSPHSTSEKQSTDKEEGMICADLQGRGCAREVLGLGHQLGMAARQATYAALHQLIQGAF
eukprot:701821-Pelagomonas_calceolata.AAC.4